MCVEILVATVYRPPNSGSDYMNNLKCFLHELDNDNKEIIFTGDLNCDLLSDVYQDHTHKLTELLNIHQLEQVITDPTRITCNSETLIDILATNRLDKLSNCGVLHVGISDQSLVFGCFKISLPKDNPKLVETRCFKRYN